MGEHTRILLVDDDDGVRDILANVLGNAGYEVDAARMAATAVPQIEANSYDLVVTDAKLLDGSGVAVADFAKARGQKVVVLTGYAAETRPGGPQHDYLFKPLRPDAFVRAVEAYAGPPRRDR